MATTDRTPTGGSPDTTTHHHGTYPRRDLLGLHVEIERAETMLDLVDTRMAAAVDADQDGASVWHLLDSNLRHNLAEIKRMVEAVEHGRTIDADDEEAGATPDVCRAQRGIDRALELLQADGSEEDIADTLRAATRALNNVVYPELPEPKIGGLS